MKIISGGQTGVDRAALDAALSLGMECGGWCPAGRLAEDGEIPARYPLQEIPGGTYAQRTARNVIEADGTIIIHSEILRGGTEETRRVCEEAGKACLLVDASRLGSAEASDRIRQFMRAKKMRVVNVAGPRASGWPEGYAFALAALTPVLRDLTAPRLSFIVPAHNEEHELPETLRAIRIAADAAGQPYEVIVVDDASTDATAEIARRFGTRIIPVNYRQIAAVRNAGARTARGDFFFFVDADTRIAPGHVTEGMAVLAQGGAGSARVVSDDDDKAPAWQRLFLRVVCTCYFATGLGAGAFIFTTRAAFEAVGGFDEQYFAGEEVFLSRALKQRGPFKILREPIVTSARKLRLHPPRSVFRQLLLLFIGGAPALRSRERLGIWYDGKREDSPA